MINHSTLPTDPAALLSLLVDVYMDGFASGANSALLSIVNGGSSTPPGPEAISASRDMASVIAFSMRSDPAAMDTAATLIEARLQYGDDAPDKVAEPVPLAIRLPGSRNEEGAQ